MADLLTDTQIETALAGLGAWSREGDSITRTAELADFPQAIQVVNVVAERAETAQHHPDIDIRWRTLTFTLSTHSEGGLTEKDTALAARIDEAISSV
ncbi:4a-hydroxytetrahydrobiopterin dehydratase [Amycolatopsis antarctica]|uniref:Putative pterin-4-alpha-carbinolamine dehydratase n=1 Tax=Amycolatopsis antarctica TaxID=1854586 RepID=A0A263D5K8_9PSEU|nr:4a-hydroxytetrahydrobiopterin dehydratase [Amycolatopsis antarctica]OZM73661.1 4a-hydroxytetrahydrobiopterin dehydratase [Amycolatopsis antarctica]